jgi:hypothetical protein
MSRFDQLLHYARVVCKDEERQSLTAIGNSVRREPCCRTSFVGLFCVSSFVSIHAIVVTCSKKRKAQQCLDNIEVAIEVQHATEPNAVCQRIRSTDEKSNSIVAVCSKRLYTQTVA